MQGDGEGAEQLGRLLELRPAVPFAGSKGIATTLRPYQRLGVDWLLFLDVDGPLIPFGGPSDPYKGRCSDNG